MRPRTAPPLAAWPGAPDQSHRRARSSRSPPPPASAYANVAAARESGSRVYRLAGYAVAVGLVLVVAQLFRGSSLYTGAKRRDWVTDLIRDRMARDAAPVRVPKTRLQEQQQQQQQHAPPPLPPKPTSHDDDDDDARGDSTPSKRLHAWTPRDASTACPPEYGCGSPPQHAAAPPPLGPDDVVLAVDFLSSWHWCPAALSRAQRMEPAVYEFLDAARAAGALVVHAVSDSKMHYLSDPAVAPHVVLASSVPESERAPREGAVRDWQLYTREFLTRDFSGYPPPPLSLGVHLVCGNAGRAIFDARDEPGSAGRKPAHLKGLKAERLRRGDVVAAELDAVYAVVARRRPKRVVYVGVHLELCILYSRWFSLLRVAHWPGLERAQLAVVVPLVDVSNSDADDPDVTRQVERDEALIDKMACWIRCVAATHHVRAPLDERVVMLDWR